MKMCIYITYLLYYKTVVILLFSQNEGVLIVAERLKHQWTFLVLMILYLLISMID